ncbi:MAG: hypothetical protein R3E66_16450 [bacterium]
MILRLAFLMFLAAASPTLAAAQDAATERAADEVPLNSDDPYEQLLDLPPSGSLEQESSLSTTPKPLLKQQGFVFSDEVVSTTTTTAALVALTAGIPLHGIGHLWIDDTRTATALMVSEGASILVMGAAALAAYADDGSSSITGIAAPAFQLGFTGFVLTYLLDVIGTLQGSDILMPSNFRHRPGWFGVVSYGFVTSSEASSRHLIRAQAGLDFDVGKVTLETTQNVLLGASQYKAIAGARLLRFRRQSFLTIDAVGDYYRFAESGAFDRLGVEARIGGSLDLGAFFSQFNDVAIGTWLGVGRQYYTFGGGFSTSTDFLSNYSYLNLNLTQKLNMQLGHGSHPTSDVPSLTRLFGVTDLEFMYQTNFGFLRFRTELGDGAAFWLGGDVRF